MGNFRISACLCPRGTDVMHILHYRTRKSQENSPPELNVSGQTRSQGPSASQPNSYPRRSPKSPKFAQESLFLPHIRGVQAGKKTPRPPQNRPRGSNFIAKLPDMDAETAQFLNAEISYGWEKLTKRLAPARLLLAPLEYPHSVLARLLGAVERLVGSAGNIFGVGVRIILAEPHAYR